MKVTFKRTFLRDLEKVPQNIKGRVEDLVFRKIPAAEELHDIPNVVKLKGFDQFFRVRIGNYRVGLGVRDEVSYLLGTTAS